MNTTGRNYKREEMLQGPRRKEARRKRQRARYAVMRLLTHKYGATKAGEMMQGKDVDHIKPLAVGGSNKITNFRLRSEHSNRADKKIFAGSRTTRPKHHHGHA
jgi:hypothetical protein